MFSGPYGLISGGKVWAAEKRHFCDEDRSALQFCIGFYVRHHQIF